MLNVVEDAMHLLRQRCLHHRPYNMKMPQIEEPIRRKLLKKKLLPLINIKAYWRCSCLSQYDSEKGVRQFFKISAHAYYLQLDMLPIFSLISAGNNISPCFIKHPFLLQKATVLLKRSTKNSALKMRTKEEI